LTEVRLPVLRETAKKLSGKTMPATKFDTYTWRARIVPAFLVFLPLAIAIFLWIPDIMLIGRLAGIVLGPLGIAMLMAQIGRDLGYKKQPRLWEQWGGAPTTQLLRHRNPQGNPVLRERYHRNLMKLQSDLILPAPEEEEQDPQKADHIYETCVRYLITRTRDRKQFQLLFNENVNYGFRRNLWGMKVFGALFAILGLTACVLYLWLYWKSYQRFSAEAVVGSLFNLIFLLFWLFWVTRSWVRIAADAYAERLLETCEHLQSEN
jgi:hypothetical protein